MIGERYAPLAGASLFSIQTQSLYDASIDGLPHFVYTDHTHLANLKYPGADPRSSLRRAGSRSRPPSIIAPEPISS